MAELALAGDRLGAVRLRRCWHSVEVLVSEFASNEAVRRRKVTIGGIFIHLNLPALTRQRAPTAKVAVKMVLALEHIFARLRVGVELPVA